MKHAAIFAVFFLTCVALFSLTPKYTVEARREHAFVVNMPFKDVQAALRRDDMLAKVLEANDGELLDKQVVDKDLYLHRPLSKKHRDWRLHSICLCKIRIRDDRAGDMVVDLKQTLHAVPDYIRVEVELAKPMDVGLSKMDQLIEIKSCGENQTIISMKLYMKLERMVPSFMQKMARDEVHKAADKQIGDFEPILRNHLENYKPGFFRIPLP